MQDEEAVRRDLLDWYDAHRRDLPWRRTRDPYAVWVSEVMLQQTRVETVLPYYRRWMEAFPDVEALAAADEEEVMARWSGLGYYRRGHALHRAARTVVQEHGGRLPATAAGLRRLPGVGPYTAGAVASIAFGEAVPAVDGNARRVLARLAAVRGPVDSGAGARRIDALAARLVDPERPGDWNQALMDLGATVCRVRDPRCAACPLARACRARAQGTQAQVPPPRRRPPVQEEEMHFALVRRDTSVLLVEAPRDGLLGGTWRLPGGPPDRPLEAWVQEQTGLHVHPGEPQDAGTHRFTHRLWRMHIQPAILRSRTPLAPGAHWVAEDRLDHAPLATATRKALAAAGVGTPRRVADAPPRPSLL